MKLILLLSGTTLLVQCLEVEVPKVEGKILSSTLKLQENVIKFSSSKILLSPGVSGLVLEEHGLEPGV